MTDQEIMEHQNSIIEWQRIIIESIIGRFSTDPCFAIPEETQAMIREVNGMYNKLTQK